MMILFSILHIIFHLCLIQDLATNILIDSTPPIYPDAYTTVPLSRAAFNLSGHYEMVNVYVHVIRTLNGAGGNKREHGNNNNESLSCMTGCAVIVKRASLARVSGFVSQLRSSILLHVFTPCE